MEIFQMNCKGEKIILDDYGIENEYKTEDEIEQTNKDRIELLERKYSSTEISPEELTRIKILNEKLNKILPNISDLEMQFADKLVKNLEKVDKKIKKYKTKYKI